MNTISKEEQLLLLELLLLDIEMNWSYCFNERVYCALDLAKILNLKPHINRINKFLMSEFSDGKIFNVHYRHGGYNNLYKLHKLDYSLSNKSNTFQKLALKYLTCPDLSLYSEQYKIS